MNVNKVILVGRLTRDPEMRTTPTGQTVASVTLATNSFWTDKTGQKQEKTEFHNIVLWGRLAEITGQYLTKGQEGYFEGRLQTRKYTDKNNIERYRTEIIAENMQLGSRPQGQAQGTYAPKPAVGYNNSNTASSKPQESPAEEIPTINLDDEEEVKIEDVPF
jgi:single-strand DNA-binding protein